MNNFIFLDIDGVLNNESFLLQHKDDDGCIDEEKVKILADFAIKYDAKIVLSSSWKSGFDNNMEPVDYTITLFDGLSDKTRSTKLKEILEKYGIKLYGKTPTAEHSSRYYYEWERLDEIQQYLDKNLEETDNYVIFDDENAGLSDQFSGHYVGTDFYKDGLNEDAIFRASLILDKEV